MFSLWGRKSASHHAEENLAAAQAYINQSASGAELAAFCRDREIKIELKDRDDPALDRAAGSYDRDKTITIAKDQSRDQMVGTLVHEMEHVRQIADGKYLDPRTISLDQCKENRCENEAKAESKANQVLVELAQRDIKAPLAAKLERADSAQEQCQVYVLNRRFGADHETAAKESEPLWGKNGIRKDYEARAAMEWKNATRHDDLKAQTPGAARDFQPAVSKPAPPQSTSREAAPAPASAEAKPIPAWKAKWADHVQKTKLPDPPTRPPESQTRSRGRGR